MLKCVQLLLLSKIRHCKENFNYLNDSAVSAINFNNYFCIRCLFLHNIQFYQCHSGWIGAVGYRWPGRLRSTASSFLSRYRRHSYVFLDWFARLAPKHSRKVGSRSQTLLPQRSYRPRRQQEGLKVRPALFCSLVSNPFPTETAAASSFQHKKEIKWRPGSVLLRTSSAPLWLKNAFET